jgi:stearoyl-CoA desaturase (delta-9 desaturase)
MNELLVAIIFGIIWSEIISHFGASILLHRYYCHKQFKVPVWFEIIGLYMLSVAYIRSPIGWIASHRMHHKFSDTDRDPHSWQHIGKWKVLTTTWNIPRIPVKFSKDLYKNPRLVFFHKYHIHLLIAHNAISLLISPCFWLAYAVIPFIFAKVGFGLLNTFGHNKEGGSNVWWLNFFVAGEGYHKNHHDNWNRVRLHKWDTAGWLAEKLFTKK